MADVAAVTAAGALLASPSTSGTEYEGFVLSQVHGVPEYHWIRIRGVDPLTGSPARAGLAAAPSLEALLGGAGALDTVCARLRGAPSVAAFLADLQEVLERLAYSSGAGPGPASGAVQGWSRASCASSSWRLMQLLLGDLDSLGWGCLEELEQDAARLTLLHVDPRGRQHRLRLSLPPTYPTAPPGAATDLPTPFAFGWRPPAACGADVDIAGATTVGAEEWRSGAGGGREWGHPYTKLRQQIQPHAGGGGPGSGGSCSSIADVFWAFAEAVSRLQPLWSRLDELDRRTRVLDPPPSVSASRRHIGPPSRRLALGGPASLQLRLDPADPAGPPAPGGVAFLGPPGAVAALREGFFGRLHLWSRERDIVDNLEELLGQPLPPPRGAVSTAGRSGITGAAGAAADGDEQDALLAECAICRCYRLELEDPDAEPEEGQEVGEGGAGGSGAGGLVPEVVCPTPACGLPFHAPCLAEWLRSLPDTRQSFNSLFGRCPFCSNPITVRA